MVCLLLGLCLALTLAACHPGGSPNSKGADSAEAAFAEFFDALQSGQVEKAKGYLSKPESALVLSNVRKEQGDTILALLSNASYDIVSANEFDAGQFPDLPEDDASPAPQSPQQTAGAILQVSIHGKDISQVTAQVSRDITADLSAFSSKKDKEKQKFIQQSIQSAMSHIENSPDLLLPVLVTKTENGWKLQDVNEVARALLGDGAILDL